MLSKTTIDQLARELLEAERTRQPVPLLSARYSISREAAYAIQRRRLQLQGEVIIGYKLGFTSEAMRQQMGVADPNYGELTVRMELGSRAAQVPLVRFIHPRVEPEIAVVMKRDLEGPGVTSHEVSDAIALVAPALEIVDTRYEGYRFTAEDNIADNSSAAGFVLGIPRLPGPEDLALVGMALYQNGRWLAGAAGCEAMGHPLESVRWLVGELARHGRKLKAGDVVLTGGLTRAYPLKPGDTFVALFDRLGTVMLTGVA